MVKTQVVLTGTSAVPAKTKFVEKSTKGMIKKTHKLESVHKSCARKISLDTGYDSKNASSSKHDAYSQSLCSDVDLQQNAGPVQARRKIIFDTDMGADDAVAYLVCMAQPDVEVLAVTTVSGNHHVDQVGKNVATMNRNMDTAHVPIHRGCEQGIIDQWNVCGWEGHGKDGLGDSVNLKRDNLQKIDDKHAVQAIIDLVQAHPNEVELLMIGPLTNLGMAIRLEPSLPSLIKSVTVMGGTIGGKGNHTAAAEFNFILDPEAADIVFKSFEVTSDEKPKILQVAWEPCLNHKLSWEFYDSLVGRGKKAITKNGFILKEITGKMEKYCRVGANKLSGGQDFTPCDVYAAACMLDSSLIAESDKLHVQLERGGKFSRGHTVIDWYEHHTKSKTADVVMSINQQAFEDYLTKVFCE